MPPCFATTETIAPLFYLPNFYSSGQISRRQITEKLADPLDRLRDRLAAVGIRKPQIAFAELTEARAGDRRDSGLFEKHALQPAGIQSGPRHVGEGIKGAAGQSAAKPGEAIEGGDDHRASLGEGGDHAVDRLARALQCGDPSELGGRVDAGMAVDREPL